MTLDELLNGLQVCQDINGQGKAYIEIYPSGAGCILVWDRNEPIISHEVLKFNDVRQLTIEE